MEKSQAVNQSIDQAQQTWSTDRSHGDFRAVARDVNSANQRKLTDDSESLEIFAARPGHQRESDATSAGPFRRSKRNTELLAAAAIQSAGMILNVHHAESPVELHLARWGVTLP